MPKSCFNYLLTILLGIFMGSGAIFFAQTQEQAVVTLRSKHLAAAGTGALSGSLRLDGIFFETAQGRAFLPAKPGALPDGRVIKLALAAEGDNFILRLSAEPDADIIKWGLALGAGSEEYYTGLMERVVDGAQAASWAPGIKEAMNLRGQKVDMIIKPTTSVYAPFYLSSRGYAVLPDRIPTGASPRLGSGGRASP